MLFVVRSFVTGPHIAQAGLKTHCVDKDNLEFLILLPPPPPRPLCWDCRYAGSCWVDTMLAVEGQTPCMLGVYSTNPATALQSPSQIWMFHLEGGFVFFFVEISEAQVSSGAESCMTVIACQRLPHAVLPNFCQGDPHLIPAQLTASGSDFKKPGRLDPDANC